MKYFLFLFALVLFSCNKEPNKDSQKNISIRYVVTANHLTGSAKIKRWKLIGTNTDFTDTVLTAQSETTIDETIYYAQCPEQLIFGAMIINSTSSTDSIFTQIFIDGQLKATGIKAGQNNYFNSEITTNIYW